MQYQVEALRDGYGWEWVWVFPTRDLAKAECKRLRRCGYDGVRITPV